MCDYCDCRLQPAIAELSAEHDELRALTAEVRRTTGDVPAVVRRLADLLVAHADREERGVFSALERAGVARGYVAGFECDHAALHTLLRAAIRGDAAAAAALADLLDDHILREESDLFPAARQLLAPEDWDLVDAAHHPTPAIEGASA